MRQLARSHGRARIRRLRSRRSLDGNVRRAHRPKLNREAVRTSRASDETCNPGEACRSSQICSEGPPNGLRQRQPLLEDLRPSSAARAAGSVGMSRTRVPCIGEYANAPRRPRAAPQFGLHLVTGASNGSGVVRHRRSVLVQAAVAELDNRSRSEALTHLDTALEGRLDGSPVGSTVRAAEHRLGPPPELLLGR